MSSLILGTVQMGMQYGINNHIGKISKSACTQILNFAYDAGINTLDTAEVYGDAHELIGAFHQENLSKKFKVITKLPSNIIYDSIGVKVGEYIQQLNLDSIEVLMFHSFDSFLNNKKKLDELNSLKLSGILNHIGVSVYKNEELEYLLNEDLITVVQLPFNLIDNKSIKGELMKMLKSKGKILHTRSAFLQGIIFKDITDENPVVKKLYNELTYLNKLTETYNCTKEQLALSYCLNQPYIDNVIIGVDSLNQLVSNIESSTYKISDNLVKLIDDIRVSDINLLNPSLWRKVQ